jgi:transposase
LKEELRLVFTLKGVRATVLLQAWLAWARRCRIPAFAILAKAIAQHRADIQAALTEGLSNGRVEAVNTKIRLLTQVAFGFKSPRRSSPWPCSASAAYAHPGRPRLTPPQPAMAP